MARTIALVELVHPTMARTIAAVLYINTMKKISYEKKLFIGYKDYSRDPSSCKIYNTLNDLVYIVILFIISLHYYLNHESSKK